MKISSSMRFLLTAAALMAAAGPISVWAQDYPARPIRLIVGFVPGGIVDLIARSLGIRLAEGLHQQVIIDNRAGAGGGIAMQIAARAVPDGYTLLMGSSTQFSIFPALSTGLPYDPIRDYTAITQAAFSSHLLTVLPSFPARSLPELIQVAKTRPDQVMSYSSPGYGAAPHIAAELMKRVAGINVTHVPYKGGGEAMIALMSGQVQMSFGAVSTARPHVLAGRLRALGVTSSKRLSAVPEVPTFAEGGLAGFDVIAWFGVFAPAHLPPAIARKLNATLAHALDSAELKAQFSDQGVELTHSTPQEFAAYVKNELVRWTRTLKELGISNIPSI